MINLLIVEDNDFERNALLRNIQWDILGIHVADTAFDGADGLEKALRLKPDIVLSDVMMPGMNGIEMAKRILEALPAVRIVFASGFGDVELLKNAMEVHAYNYIIKPVKPEELTRTIRRMSAEVVDEKLLRKETDSLQRQYAENIDYLREKFLAGLLQGELPRGDADETYARAAGLGMNLSGNYRIAVIQLECGAGNHSGPDEAAERLIAGLRAERDLGRCLFAHAGSGGVVAFMPATEGKPFSAEQPVEIIVSLLKRDADAGLYRYSVGLSESAGSIREISALYRQSLVSAERRVELGYGRVIRYGDLDEAGPDAGRATGLADAEAIYSAVAEKVFLGEDAGAELQALAGLPYPTDARLNRAKSVYAGLVGSLSRKMGLRGESFGAISENETDIYYEIIQAATIPDIAAYLRKLLASLTACYGRQKLNRDDIVAGEIVKILEADYAKPITLDYLSDKVFLSPNYLRILFKSKMNVSIQDYLVNVRMSKARELLRQGKLKVYEVGETVGYPNNTYFNIAFKNHTGMTPGEYRSKHMIGHK
jgi:two-component system response regulator YesN